MANIRRLKSLLAFLDTVPKERFNLEAWGETPTTAAIIARLDSLVKTENYLREKQVITEEFNKVFNSLQKLKNAACGTTACALGWAAVKPSFRKAGLHFYNVEDCYGTISAVVEYEGKKGLYAGELFFNIDNVTAEYLFFPEQYGRNRGLSEVKRRLAVVIRNKGKAPAGRIGLLRSNTPVAQRN